MSLLCLDNCESVIEHDRDGFTAVLSRLHRQCANLRVIVTSTCGLGQLPDTPDPRPFVLQRLNAKDSVDLFLQNSGSRESLEIAELVLADTDFPLRKFYADIERKSQSQIKEELLKTIDKRADCATLLAEHDMFRHLVGNPCSIRLLAAISLQRILPKLTNVYEAVLEARSKLSESGRGNTRLTDKKAIANRASLQVALETSLSLLDDESLGMLLLLGCMPGGASPPQVTAVWPTKSEDVQSKLQLLKQLSLIEPDGEAIQLPSSIFNSIDNSLEFASKKLLILRVCKFYEQALLQ